MNGIIRVFPKRTSYTPDDDYVFIGLPPLREYIPTHKEVHVSCTFTWDRRECEELTHQWQGATDKPVKLGGPAYASPARDFVQGMYLHKKFVLTTRGCNNKCLHCVVWKNEGKLRELPICEGNNIQDNNFLQASRAHKDKVFAMLRNQKSIRFKGGLQADLIDDHFIGNITTLRVSEIWLACDSDAALPTLKKAAQRLSKAGFNRNKLKCYALVGDDMDKNEARLREIYHAGVMPYAMLYRDFADTVTEYSDDWRKFARQWQRPPAIEAHIKQGTHYKDFMKIQNSRLECKNQLDIS